MFRSERPVFRRQSSAEKVLQRANQRLQQRGSVHRDDSSDNEDDINNYLSSLRKKTTGGTEKQTKRVAIVDGASDISISDSSENTSMARVKPQSKFLKSKTPASSTPVASQSTFSTPKASAIGADAIRRSAALAKASSLTGRFARGSREPEKTQRSNSPEMLYAKSSRAKLNYLTDEESASIGRDGSKFLRKKEKKTNGAKSPAKSEERDGNLTPKTRKQLRFAGLSDDDDDDEVKELGAKSPKTPSSHSSSINSGRLRRSLTISDEDMSTAELGEGIISSSSGPDTPKKPALKSPSTPTSPKKRVTIAEVEVAQDVSEASDLSFLEDNIVERLGRSSSSSEEEEEEEEMEEVSDSEMTSSHVEMVENVMDVDDLKSDDSSSSRPALDAIQTIDDLSSISAVSEDHVKSSPSSPSSSTSTSATVIQSETRGVSQYDSDFEASEIVSEKTRPTAPTSTYSQDFESSTHSSTSRTDYSSESEETTVTESYTKRVHHRRRRKGSRDEDKSVQTVDVGLSYHWHATQAGQPYVGEPLGMSAVDLNPIAHYVVPPESLEGVTAYNPCVVALNNLLRQQLQMTQDFMATQRRLYDAMSRTILPEHSYTTLEETKKFIAKHRPPTISMDDALREVEQEMNSS